MKWGFITITLVCLLLAGCDGFLTTTPVISGGSVPSKMEGTWYSEYSLTKATITGDAVYSYSYDGEKQTKGGIDVDTDENTIHYAETYYWNGSLWAYDEDPIHIRANYVLDSNNYLYTDAFYVEMYVYKRTSGTSGELFGTWEYQWQEWYGLKEDYTTHRKYVLTLDSDNTYERKEYMNGDLDYNESGSFTYGDDSEYELYLETSGDTDNAWVIKDDYLVLGPSGYSRKEIALIKE
jgi:hypothetical protein